jgi:hypothetical protein
VGDSLRGDVLSVANPEYVRVIARGLVLLIAGSLVTLAWWVAIPLLFGVGVGNGLLAPRAALVLGQSIDLLGAMLLLAGWWMLSTPDPALPSNASSGGRRDHGVRRALRAVLVAIAAISAIGFIGLFTPGLANTGLSGIFGNIVVNANAPVPALLWVAIVLRVALVLLRASRFFLGLAYLETLAARIPDRDLALAVRRQRWQFPLWMTVGWLLVIGPIIGAVRYMGVLVRLQRAVARAAERSPSAATTTGAA